MTDEFGDMRTAYGKALTELGEQDKNICLLYTSPSPRD